ncbi:MAG: ABC transporter ATP-binding protein [Oscillospiraceae bacterium]
MCKFISRIMKLSGEYRSKLNRALVFSFFESLFANVPVFMILYVINEIIVGSFSSKTIVICSVGIVLGIIIRMTLRYLVDINQSGVGYEIFARERLTFGDRIKRFPMGFFSEGNIGNITSVLTNDISFVEEHGMDTLGKITSSLLGMIISFCFLFYLNWQTALAMLAAVALFVISFTVMQRVAAAESKSQQEAQNKLVGTVIEYIKGMPVVKAFNLAGDSHKATARDFKRLSDAQVRFEKRFAVPMIFTQCASAVGIAAIILVCGIVGLNGGIELPYTIGISVFAFELVAPMLVLAGITAFRVAEASLDRYDNVRSTEVIDDSGKDIKLTGFDVEFENVTFGYEEQDVLKNISFRVPQNSMTALVGRSGCGKSTIVNLVARFWDVDSGAVRIGGVNVKDMTTESLLKNISVVFQNVYLFNDTVFNNVAFGKKGATREEVIEACKKARCHDFITELDNGYDTIVGEGGSTLSGGEKQRISIARAILKDAPVVLLDEATASIDPDNEVYIQQAINEMIKGKTLIVIAHKLPSIMNADQILMIDNGRIIEKGTHAELLELDGAYAELWKKQMQN